MCEAAATMLPDGLVNLKQYDELLASRFFRDIEAFSESFLRATGSAIDRYNQRWVQDPLHQWSRQWEYPYIISQAREISKDASVIDLGAGISFLPYYLKSELGLKEVVAIDSDKMLDGLYSKVNDAVNEPVLFKYGDMRELSAIGDAKAEFVYSVSVLEHTNAYDKILKEVSRILRPGGKLSITFDISLDGLDDIPLDRARELLYHLQEIFSDDTGIDLERELQKPDLVTSRVMAQRDRKLMPWKYPLINVVKPLFSHGRPGRRYKKLAFCCVTVTKPSIRSAD